MTCRLGRKLSRCCRDTGSYPSVPLLQAFAFATKERSLQFGNCSFTFPVLRVKAVFIGKPIAVVAQSSGCSEYGTGSSSPGRRCFSDGLSSLGRGTFARVCWYLCVLWCRFDLAGCGFSELLCKWIDFAKAHSSPCNAFLVSKSNQRKSQRGRSCFDCSI